MHSLTVSFFIVENFRALHAGVLRRRRDNFRRVSNREKKENESRNYLDSIII